MVLTRAIAVCLFCGLTVSAREVLTSLSALRSLTVEEASNGVPVRVEGTVAGLDPAASYHFFLHDGSAGCFVKTRPSGRPAGLVPGDRVKVEGVSDPLGYYPSVKDAKVTILGKGKLPEPVTPGAGQMFSPQLDSEWVEVPAVVTGYEVGDDRLTLAVEVHGLPFKAELPLTGDAEARAAALMQRPVRLRGIMGTIFNRQRQMTDRHFFVSSPESITPTVPQSGKENGPLLGVAQLLTGSVGPSTLVRVRGVITQRDSKGFYLRDATGSTLVQAATPEPLAPGTAVEVEGFGAVAPFRPILRATHVRKHGPREAIHPVPLEPEETDLSAMHSEWVTLDADFLGSRTGPVEGILQFRGGSRFFEALQPVKSYEPGGLPNVGDRVRLTGICELTTSHALPRLIWVDGFRIHLPADGGMEILRRAPWWTTRRLLGALGLMSGVAAIGVLATWMLRRQVNHQMGVISDKLRAEAVGEERDRMARELHDTLEQQLSGVALQLDGLDAAVKQNPAAASASLTLARRMLRYTRLEARRSVWDLRSKVLEKDGLAAALRAIGESGGQSAAEVGVEVIGEERQLPAGVDFHLLRIAQEATTNAVKHGSARSVRISLEYLPGKTALTIRDDGCGFDAAGTRLSDGPHFGILGMRERAGKIGADLVITSAPEEGCTVSVTVGAESQNHPHA
jgi:signal transduction histidine kinase